MIELGEKIVSREILRFSICCKNICWSRVTLDVYLMVIFHFTTLKVFCGIYSKLNYEKKDFKGFRKSQMPPALSEFSEVEQGNVLHLYPFLSFCKPYLTWGLFFFLFQINISLVSIYRGLSYNQVRVYLLKPSRNWFSSFFFHSMRIVFDSKIMIFGHKAIQNSMFANFFLF